MCIVGLVQPNPPEVDEDTLAIQCCAQIQGVNTIAPGRSVTVNLATQPGSAQGMCTVYTARYTRMDTSTILQIPTAWLLDNLVEIKCCRHTTTSIAAIIMLFKCLLKVLCLLA